MSPTSKNHKNGTQSVNENLGHKFAVVAVVWDAAMAAAGSMRFR